MAGDISKKHLYTAVSLFSGAMGLDIGLEKTGRFKILACVESDENCLKTIQLNRDKENLTSKEPILFGDIKKITPRELLDEIGFKAGEIDLITGGPPCQSFSTAGKRGTVQDARGTLIWDYYRFVKEIRPRFFLMENVRGLLSAAIRHRPIAKRGPGYPPLNEVEKPGSVVKLLLSDFEKKGYRVDVFEVNAVNYGAPQLRERVLFIGNNYNLSMSFPEPTHVSREEYENCKPQEEPYPGRKSLLPFRTLGDAIRGIKDDNPIIMDFSPRKKKYLSLVPPGGNWRALPEDLQRESMGKAFYAKGGRSGWWRRLSYDLPCPCLVTMPNHAGTSLCHPEEVRALSVREYARIQEFPDTWEFVGRPIDIYRQIGNAVPVRLGIVAGEVIASHLDIINESEYRRFNSGDKVKPSKIIYIKSHVRTRRWYKDGKAVIDNLNGCTNQNNSKSR